MISAEKTLSWYHTHHLVSITTQRQPTNFDVSVQKIQIKHFVK